MKLLKAILISLVVGLVFVGITDQFASSKYPSCDLVSKGIGISTYGCSNSASNNEPCNNLSPNSSKMTQCVAANYFKYRSFPFGFKQKFGPDSNLNDPTPKRNNEIATFALGFVLAAIAVIPLSYRKSLRKTDHPAAQIDS